MARISETILLAINRFSRLKRAVKYTRFRFSTKVRNRSFPGCELILPPRPHRTSLSAGTLTQDGSSGDTCVAAAVAAAVDALIVAVAGDITLLQVLSSSSNMMWLLAVGDVSLGESGVVMMINIWWSLRCSV
jgi:hypothetical protein